MRQSKEQRNEQRRLGISHWKQWTCLILQGDQHSTCWIFRFGVHCTLVPEQVGPGSSSFFHLPARRSPPYNGRCSLKMRTSARLERGLTDAFGQKVVARDDMHSGRRKQRTLFFH